MKFMTLIDFECVPFVAFYEKGEWKHAKVLRNVIIVPM